LRSKTLDISPIASKFNGGGHKNASGFKLDNKADFNKVIDEIKKCN
jgi:nanoRNase/pAp phosphatase (c-di-AMP/oligoRNAs hydrolase)